MRMFEKIYNKKGNLAWHILFSQLISRKLEMY